MMKNDDFNLLRGFADGQTDGLTDEQTDICDCRVAFATDNSSGVTFATKNSQKMCKIV